MSLWLPPKVSRELRDSSRAQYADIVAQTDPSPRGGSVGLLNRELRAMDPYLQVIQAKPGATAAGLRAGFWHLLRHNPGAPPSVIALEHRDGSFREPGGWVLELARSSDLWNDRVSRDREKALQVAQIDAQREKDRERDDRRDEIRERVDSAMRVQVRKAA